MTRSPFLSLADVHDRYLVQMGIGDKTTDDLIKSQTLVDGAH